MGEKNTQPTMAISGGILAYEVVLPSGWFLHIYADGGARLGYGPNDVVKLPAGSFSGAQVFVRLSTGTRRGEGSAGDVKIVFVEEVYSARSGEMAQNREAAHCGDVGMVRDYFEKAMGLAPGGNRLAEIWGKYPPFPLPAAE
jgi:hypothetical protein